MANRAQSIAAPAAPSNVVPIHTGPTVADRLATAGTDVSLLVDSAERQLQLIDAASEGFGKCFASLPRGHALRRYATVLGVANEQLRQDLGALLEAVR
jgi:hypothetical protein